MTTLTQPQIDYLRAKSGDDCTPPVVSDALLQVYYGANGDNLPCTILSVLEDRWAAVTAGASKLTDFGTSVDTSEMDHIKDLMDYWNSRCGSGAAIVVDTVNTYRADSRQTEEPDYSNLNRDTADWTEW